MGPQRFSIHRLSGAYLAVAVAVLASLWLAQTPWPGTAFLRTEILAPLRIADIAGLLALLVLVVLLVLLRRREHQAGRTTDLLRQALEGVGEGAALVDARGRIVFASGPLGELFGYAPAELLDRPVDLVLPGWAPGAAPPGPPGRAREYVGRRKDGRTVPFELSVSPPSGGPLTALVVHDVTRSRLTRETLVTRETYLRLVVEQMPAILWTTDAKLQITSTVGAGLASLDLKAKDVIGMTMLDCLERQQLECTPINAHLKALHGESLSYEMEWKGRTFQVRVDPLRNSEKAITGTIGILVDVTDHKQAMAELKVRARQQAAVAELGQRALEGPSPETLMREAVTLIGQTLDVELCAVLEAQPDGQTFAARAVFGWGEGRGEVPGVEAQAAYTLRAGGPVLVADTATEKRFTTPGAVEGRRIVSGISTIIHGGRRPFGVLTAHTSRRRPFTPDDSHFIQAVAHILATTIQRKHAEEARARLVAILEATTDCVVMTGTDRRLLYVNRAGRALLGIGLEEDVSGRTLADLYPAGLRPLLKEAVDRAVRDGTWSGETTLRSRTGAEVPVSQVLLAHKSPAGAFEFLSTIARDTSERQRLEEQLRQAQKMEAVGRLAGGIAHDFNNLLCVITGYSTLLADGVPDDDPLHEFVTEIGKAAERAATLTRQLLAFSRKQMLVPRVLNLNALITDLDKMLRRVIGEDIELIAALEPTLHPVQADQGQVEQILMNLVVNARDAMPTGGRLTIATRNAVLESADLRDCPDVAPGRYVRLEVSDTGCGMDREVLAHLFEPFFTTKGPGKGTGLGLATVFGIIKQSGGHIRVTSEPGRGSTFHIYLPSIQRVESSGSADGSSAAAVRGGAETVLLVEDEEGIRALAGRCLRERGYHVLEAGDGEEALTVSAGYQQSVDLLLSDVVMPRLSGHALAQRLTPQRPHMRVLFMSGFSDSALFRHGVVTGEVECLLKPFTPEALLQKVREVLDRPAPNVRPTATVT